MQQQNYILDENVPESFEFQVGGHKYRLRYPTTEESKNAPSITNEKNPDPAEVKASEDWMYSFITPVDDKAPAIAEVMNKVNVRVQQNFRKMIESEFQG